MQEEILDLVNEFDEVIGQEKRSIYGYSKPDLEKGVKYYLSVIS